MAIDVYINSGSNKLMLMQPIAVSGGGGGGSSSRVFRQHVFYAGGGGTFAYSNQPAALNYWGGNNGRRAVGLLDLTGCTQYRVDAFISAGSSVGKAFVGYRTDLPIGSVVPTSGLTSWLSLGTDIALDVNRISGTGWQPLPAALLADPLISQTALALMSELGDAVQDPAFGHISVFFQ